MSFDYDAARAAHDPQDMWSAIRDFPEHFHEGWVRAADLQPRHRSQDLDHVVILGMGGSAIGGDLLRTYALSESRVPITVVRDYVLPAWVTGRVLVIASSYSGTTEETLAAFADATERGLDAYVVSSGGELLEAARHRELPHVVLPGGMQPRAALGYSFAAVLRIADKLGLVDVTDAAFEGTMASIRASGARLADAGASRAAHLAETLLGRLTVVHTGPGLLEAVGMRWRNQLQENAKQMAYGSVFAELNHNEIMGWESAPSALRNQVAVVVLRDEEDHPQVARRMDVTRNLVASRAAAWVEVASEGTSRLARLLTTLQLGDFTSFYLAMRTGVDPTPVDTIQELKKTLAA